MSCSIFGKFDEIPVWGVENGKAVCRDAKTGKILQVNNLDLKDRLKVDFFERFRVKLLCDVQKDIKGKQIVKSGTEVFGEIIPAGQVYLFETEHSVICIKTDAIEHIDFEVI